MNVSEIQTFKSRQVLNSEVSLINVETKKMKFVMFNSRYFKNQHTY